MSLQRFLQDWAAPAAIGLALAAAILLLFPQLRGGPTPTSADQWQGPVSYAAAVRRATPAVVNIYSRIPLSSHPQANNPYFRLLLERMNPQQRQRMESNLGSGVIVSDEGYILTNHHVIDQADAIVVLLPDGREALAQLVGSDADFDLAVLKVDLPRLTAIEVGEPQQAEVGDVVLAIGNPLGVGQSVTQGIISATGERYVNLGAGGTGSYLQDFLQTDAAINPGNSGGALVDAHGRLLGINTTELSESGYAGGVGFAIPANIAFKVMQDIIEYGRVVPGWLGIEAQAVTPQLARAFNLGSSNGVIVTAIYNQGPAHQAGLQPGDVITHIDGLPINDGIRGVAAMATLRPGDTVAITYVREGESRTVTATVSEKPSTQQNN
ncbi:Serine endoprotease DegS [Microbulbifer aggregans]|uniref:Serine endoprotease DegS n=1 Tax=Microbulbifer aggregans TaxID=1769779 RepID=A0A1C9WC92_9GAMM|nr:trypsin-like peptidase domain-containing protein [Microbulbifer aggregans]AOS98765.1 Serine endoprotease DegS [Microbulbifer aggregans]